MKLNFKKISLPKSLIVLTTTTVIASTLFLNEKTLAASQDVELTKNNAPEIIEYQEEEVGVMQPTPENENGITPFIDQRPNANVLLANFSGVTGVSISSNYCTATQSHINLQVVNTGSSNITHWLYTRAPGGNWVKQGTLGTETRPGGSYVYNRNALRGHDYKVLYQPRLPGIRISGQITCW